TCLRCTWIISSRSSSRTILPFSATAAEPCSTPSIACSRHQTLQDKMARTPSLSKKHKEFVGLWEVRKEILSWVFDGAMRCIELSVKKQEAILVELKTVLRIKSGVPFKRVEKLMGKLRHVAIRIPGGKGLFGPINKLLAIKPSRVFWDRYPAARQALNDWRQLLQATAKEPAHTRKLVPG
ncbi:hypothetical protein ACHAWF_007670, partial [Thalassiosira exigua]